MKITICGSMQHESRMNQAAEQLQDFGFETALPTGDARLNMSRRALMDAHIARIDESDAILVINEDKGGQANYIGGNTLIEIAHAYTQGLEVFLLNPVPSLNYTDEINAVEPIILDGDVQGISSYMTSLPVLYVSSKSPVKHRALSRGLRHVGIRTQIQGVEVPSGVEEQPMSIEESYNGAVNRHNNMVAQLGTLARGYLATIESGFHTVHPDHNIFGCDVVVLQKVGEERRVGVNVNLEFPRSMTDKIPHQYPDVGVLVQQEFGSSLKDPYPFFTGGRLTRAKVLENSVYNLAVQMENT